MLLFIALSAACGAPAEQEAPEDTGAEPQAIECDTACMQAMVNRHLALMGEFDNDDALMMSLRGLVALGPAVLPVVVGAYNEWSRSAPPDPTQSARPGEMRWRAAHLLGQLGFREGIRPLAELARARLPDPRADEHLFADEYRVRLRAIAGLQQLGATTELQAIYARGDLLSKPAAASLYELGINVGRLRRVDARTALAQEVIDTTDNNPNYGRPAQPEKPGSRTFTVRPRTDTPASVE